MKFFTLLRANLGRHKRRTILTMASVALALFLFASLRTVITTLRAAAEFGSAPGRAWHSGAMCRLTAPRACLPR